ncbi:MAG: hypothetical protein KDD92_11460 [Caldilineaceae bacterium]|nr:hypothetical protein [Caldilineaceae bacterium]
MSTEKQQCQGMTKAGKRCKKYAQPGSRFCYLHQDQAIIAEEIAAASGVAPAEAGRPSSPSQKATRAEMEVLLTELNQLAGELQNLSPSYRAPAYSPAKLTDLVIKNIERFTPDVGVELVKELRSNLEGTSPKEFLDPDTWIGLWYVLNYTAQGQTASARAYAAERLSALPGVSTVMDLKANLAGTSPREFLDPDTWKGMYYIVNYSLQATAWDLKRKVLGEEEDEE